MLKLVKAQGQGIVSDKGRWGYQYQGVPVGGVLDEFSFAVGNLALGNPENAACLELMGQFDFVCGKPCQVFLANRGAQALLNNKPVLGGRVLKLQEGDLLRTKPPWLGFWNMLCVQGGVNVPLVMGSRSTCLPAGFGGYLGRALQVGDEIHAGDKFTATLVSEVRLGLPTASLDPTKCLQVRCLAGPEFDALTEESKQVFVSQAFMLGQQSSRMAYRLESAGSVLSMKHPLSLRSNAVHPGMVQLPPSGQPIVLLSDAQVTGGYPRIASVLASELWKFAHLGGGQGVHWVLVDAAQATRLQLQHEQETRRYHHAIESNNSENYVD
ncbi:biotin-dependent carboxyltransferase family protein [Limnobacter parvus]|uniref:Biotin-dependent carboxyltransferase family protein n=1 Tax=Limnobacter parvus TaxID=2939690 RepID=A0ABT1XHT7_9BURK|nr:biotin-dependent carboxyltransferase family protein [Limnobacter parvus]MCR2746861.1 biotin-dependent carboxyltransferase family protein [Limnobacter parvus]